MLVSGRWSSGREGGLVIDTGGGSGGDGDLCCLFEDCVAPGARRETASRVTDPRRRVFLAHMAWRVLGTHARMLGDIS